MRSSYGIRVRLLRGFSYLPRWPRTYSKTWLTTQEDDDPMDEDEDENASRFDRASFRARNFGGPDSEDEAMLQDAVTWNPDRKPAKPTTVVRKAVIDDLWNKRGQLCRDWWEKAGTRRKLVIKKIEKCLGEECPRQWTGEHYITDLATPIQWLQGIN